MKHLTTSLIIGTCLLLSSAGVGLAEDPHPFTTSGTGQPGSNNGIACGGMVTIPGTTTMVTLSGTPGHATGTPNSPFGAPSPPAGPGKKYAGAGAGNSGANPNSNANSTYDVACFQHSQVP
jgi:hypothetical protein